MVSTFQLFVYRVLLGKSGCSCRYYRARTVIPCIIGSILSDLVCTRHLTTSSFSRPNSGHVLIGGVLLPPLSYLQSLCRNYLPSVLGLCVIYESIMTLLIMCGSGKSRLLQSFPVDHYFPVAIRRELYLIRRVHSDVYDKCTQFQSLISRN